MFNKTRYLFIGGLFAIIFAGLVLVFAISFFSPEARNMRKAERDLKELTEQYKNDTYGGATPEETLVLFTEALEKGDIELASKYFLPDEQEKRKRELIGIQEKGFLEEMTNRLRTLGNEYPLIEGNDHSFVFESYNANGELILQVILAEGPSQKWKIIDI